MWQWRKSCWKKFIAQNKCSFILLDYRLIDVYVFIRNRYAGEVCYNEISDIISHEKFDFNQDKWRTNKKK